MNEFEGQLNKFLDAALDPKEAGAMAGHCKGNADARQELIETYRLHRLLTGRFQPADETAAERVLSQIRRENHPFVQSVLLALPRTPPRAGLGAWLRDCWPALDQSPRWAVSLLACSIALLLAVYCVWRFTSRLDEPVLADTRGSNITIQRGGRSMPAFGGMRLQALDTVQTGSNGTLIVRFGNEATRLEIKTETTLRFTSWRKSKNVDLLAGTLEASVAHQPLFAPMRIRTAQVEARVIGTIFTLTATSGSTRLAVEQGKVRLTRLSDHAFADVATERTCVVLSGNGDEPLAALPKTGAITREWWGGVKWKTPSDSLDDPRFPLHPDRRDLSDRFEVEAFSTNHLGFRLCGLLHPPTTGDYQFWIAAVSSARLFLSRDTSRIHMVGIATPGEAMNPRQWDAPPTLGALPRSELIHLEANHCYYIEAIAVIPAGEGHLSVAWKRPGAEREILNGQYLSPMEWNK